MDDHVHVRHGPGAGLRVHDERHDLAHLTGGVELARALPAALRELADEVFVAAPDDVALHVGQPEPLGADGLDKVAQARVVNVALAVGGGVEVDAVDDPLEQRIGVGDGAQMGGDLLAEWNPAVRGPRDALRRVLSCHRAHRGSDALLQDGGQVSCHLFDEIRDRSEILAPQRGVRQDPADEWFCVGR